MARWRVPVWIDGQKRVLLITAHSAPAAAAALSAHRARAARDRTLRSRYPTPEGSHLDIRWSEATLVYVGPIVPADPDVLR